MHMHACARKHTHTHTHTHTHARTHARMHMQRLVGELVDDDYRTDDGIEMQPSEVFSYLSRVMYNRRSKFNPLWNSLVVGGVDMEGQSFLVRSFENQSTLCM